MLWTQYIKRPQRCFFGGVLGLGDCAGIFNACHLIPRSRSQRLKFHPSNGVCSCVRHHMVLDGKLPGTPLAWKHVEKTFPGRYIKLLELSSVLAPLHKEDWKEIYETILFESAKLET